MFRRVKIRLSLNFQSTLCSHALPLHHRSQPCGQAHDRRDGAGLPLSTWLLVLRGGCSSSSNKVTFDWTHHPQWRGIKPCYHFRHLTATFKGLAPPPLYTLTGHDMQPLVGVMMAVWQLKLFWFGARVINILWFASHSVSICEVHHCNWFDSALPDTFFLSLHTRVSKFAAANTENPCHRDAFPKSSLYNLCWLAGPFM